MAAYKKYFYRVFLFIFAIIFSVGIYSEWPTKEERMGRKKNQALAEYEIYKLAEEVNARVKIEGFKSSRESVYYSVNYKINGCISYEQWRAALKRAGYEIMTIVPENRSFWKDGINGSIDLIQEHYCNDDLHLRLRIFLYKS